MGRALIRHSHGEARDEPRTKKVQRALHRIRERVIGLLDVPNVAVGQADENLKALHLRLVHRLGRVIRVEAEPRQRIERCAPSWGGAGCALGGREFLHLFAVHPVTTSVEVGWVGAELELAVHASHEDACNHRLAPVAELHDLLRLLGGDGVCAHRRVSVASVG